MYLEATKKEKVDILKPFLLSNEDVNILNNNVNKMKMIFGTK